jgi:signal transduction histidine kinase
VLAGAGGLWVAQIAIRPVRRSFERQRDFVADASHELRTPLAVVRANAESLLGKSSATDREALQDIVDESALMGRLVNDLLTLAQSDRAALDLEREHIDLFDIVQAAERAGRRLAQERDVSITTRAEHVPLDADPGRLRELLLILVDNAVRYTPAGGTVTVSCRRDGRHAEVAVEDTGVGIAPEHIERVFDRFYRVDKARSRAEGGLGLGLSIAREIVEAHGGTIDVHSEPGRGTTVRVTLLAEPSRAAEIAPEGTAAETSGLDS